MTDLDPAHEIETAPDEVLLSTMDIGDQAEKFIASELGQVLLAIAKQEADDALQKLKDVSAWDQKAILELQSRVWRAESFNGWLASLVFKGREAYSEFRDRKGEE